VFVPILVPLCPKDTNSPPPRAVVFRGQGRCALSLYNDTIVGDGVIDSVSEMLNCSKLSTAV